MDRNEALEVLLAHTCCCIKDVDACEMCPWDYTKNCDEVAFTDELLTQASRVMKEYIDS